jgi:hypothetical protein
MWSRRPSPAAVFAGVDVHIMLPHYFSRSCGPGADPIKSTLGHVTSNLCFCIRCDMWIT